MRQNAEKNESQKPLENSCDESLFKQIDSSTTEEDLFFKKIRGSVRLFLRRILLPSDVDELRNKVLSSKLP